MLWLRTRLSENNAHLFLFFILHAFLMKEKHASQDQNTCKGRMKFDIKESIEQTSQRASIAWQASLPSLPSPNASYAVPEAEVSSSVHISATSAMSSVRFWSSEVWFKDTIPAKTFRESPLTEGHPLAVYKCVCNFFIQILWSSIVRYLERDFFPFPMAFSVLRTLNDFESGKHSFWSFLQNIWK